MPTGKPRFQVDPGFNDSKELLSIPRRWRLQARGAWEAAGCWSCSKLSDGWVPLEALQELGITPYITEALIESTLWHPVGDVLASSGSRRHHLRNASASRPHRVGIQFDQWEKWQITKAQWERRDPTAAERARNYRERKKQREDPSVTGVTSQAADDDPANDPEPPSHRDTSHSREEKRTDLGKGLTSASQAVGNAALPCFPDHCQKHRHDPDPPRCGACRQTREENEHAAAEAAHLEAVQAANARKREMQRRADCWDCDEHGWRYDDDGQLLDPACRCTHPEVP